jgi:AraC-like DNA-binding protein
LLSQIVTSLAQEIEGGFADKILLESLGTALCIRVAQRFVGRLRAKTLIRRTNQPLAWVAQEVCFVDQSHLTAIFRRETGVTPGQFRAALA